MDIVAYTCENAAGYFAIRQRGTTWWRIKIDGEPFGGAFATPEEALESLQRSHAVPVELADWAPEEAYESRFNAL